MYNDYAENKELPLRIISVNDCSLEEPALLLGTGKHLIVMSYHNEDPTANLNLQESTKNRRLEQTKREENRRVNSRVKKHQLFPILLICTYSSEGFPKMHLEDRRRERGGWLYRESYNQRRTGGSFMGMFTKDT